jgi:cobalt-zinc-cadmium efflux system membrane fusion protein
MKNTLYITIFSLALLTSCKNTSEEKVATAQETEHTEKDIQVTQAQFESNHMKLEILTIQNFPEIVKTTGMIDVPPQNKEVITTFSGGYVKNSALLIGDKVKKGQALITIENPDFVEMQQEHLEISEQLSYLKNEYERQKTLFDEQITSQKSYLKAQSDYKTKLAMYNGMRKKLRMLNINPNAVEQGKITSTITLYASISGSVTKVNVSKGSYVSPADAIMEIVNTDHIHIELTVFEKDIMKIKEEQKINFKIPEATNDTFEAEVHLVGTSIDETTRTVKVHGHLHDDEKHNFAIGMFVDADIEVTSKQAMAIPEEAVVEEDDETHVLVLETQEDGNYIFEMIEVKVGKKYNGYVEIISENIKSTDKILTKGAFSLVGGEGGGHSH